MRKQDVLLAVLVILLADFLPRPARAQSEAARRADPSLHRLLTRIGEVAPRPVLLAGRGIGRVKGGRVHLHGDSVSVVSASSSRPVALVDIDSLWVQRNAARPIAIITGVGCALFGAALGNFVPTDRDSGGRAGRNTAGALRIGTLGGVICGLFGAGVGSVIKRWRLEYVRPPEAST